MTNKFQFTEKSFKAVGCGILIAGIWLYMQKNIYSILAPSSFSTMSAAGLCTAFGTMVLIISLIGIAGVLFNSYGLIISYFCFVFLLFIIQCITGLLGILYKESVHEYAKLNLHHSINLTFGETQNAALLWNTWTQMQSELHCCGAISPSDWFFYPAWKGRKFVPDSCCNLEKFNLNLLNSTQNCGKRLENSLIYKKGCVEPFTDWLLQHLKITNILTLLSGIIEIVLLLSTLRLLIYFYKNRHRCNHSLPANEFETNSLTITEK
ncbi:Tetraspanin [Meloidogyne graminicola]|uniref:Tetraspanin n=1 Tax=Meloidogyne graminicola TaxID=189291 RepID=A0A8T0A2L7_9BILA|nr:Tetraspanin [Meloidogyne graminicola]